MKSSIKLLGSALLLGAALTSAASAHDTRGAALVDLTATVLPTTSHGNSTGLAAVTANVGNIIGAKVNVGSGSLLGNGTSGTSNTGSLLNTVGSVVNTAGSTVGSVANTAGSAVHTVGSVVSSTAGSALNTVGSVVNTAGSAVHTVGSVVNTTTGSVLNTVGSTLNNTSIRPIIVIDAKIDLGGGAGSEHHGVGW